MDFVKAFFRAIDRGFNRIQNDNYKIKGADKISVVKDVIYSDSDVKTCVLDYYYPTDEKGPFPVIINIHGGGFTAGGKEFRRGLCTWYATQGFFVFNVNYGLCPECVFPTPVLHVAEAVEWVVSQAEKLNLDLKRLAIGGDSAGAYYACTVATLSVSRRLQKYFGVKMNARFGAIILNCGIYDVEEAFRRRQIFRINEKVMQSYLGLSSKDFQDYKYKEFVSPLKFINTRFPPAFLIFCEKDIFCKGQTERLIGLLQQKDVYYESYQTFSFIRNHCFSLEWKSKEAKEANEMLKDFLFRFKQGRIPKYLSGAAVRAEGESMAD